MMIWNQQLVLFPPATLRGLSARRESAQSWTEEEDDSSDDEEEGKRWMLWRVFRQARTWLASDSWWSFAVAVQEMQEAAKA